MATSECRSPSVMVKIAVLIMSFGAVTGLTTARTRSKGSTNPTNSISPLTSTFFTRTTFHQYQRNISLTARWKRPYYYEEENQGSELRQKAVESFKTPTTLTQTMIPSPTTFPPKPKIVVLGATGRVGRLVVRQLLNQCVDGTTIVAFCRDYDKACRVLFDDERQMVVRGRQKQKGPTLQIVQGNLVAPEELPGYCEQDVDDLDDEEGDWLKRAKSAAAFYGSKVQDYDNRQEHSNGNNETTASSNNNNNNGNNMGCDDALQEALRDCTAVISCVGTVRPTNVWTDWISWPVIRLLQKDVSGWCRDVRHPYYVHYASMRKVLGYVEREQLRREAVVTLMNSKNQKDSSTKHNNNHKTDGSSSSSNNDLLVIPRIRFIRISDLCVSQKPWDLVPLLTNALQSMVFRYHEMTERLLEESTLLDTVILRPGDLIDEERDVNTTALQVHTSGKVPCPARVGRSDVAALAVASALFSTHDSKKKNHVASGLKANDDGSSSSDQTDSSEAFHYTLAVRWVGEDLHPYPAQGHKQDGYRDADTCLRHALKILRRRQKNPSEATIASREKRLQAYLPATIARQVLQRRRQRRRLQPYGICTAIPVYLFLTLTLRSLCKALFGQFIVLHQPAWMVPAVFKIQEITTVLLSFLLGQIYTLWRIMPHWLTRHGAKKYISF